MLHHDSLPFALGRDLEDLAHRDLDATFPRLLLQPCGELAAVDRLEPRIVLDPLGVQVLTAGRPWSRISVRRRARPA